MKFFLDFCINERKPNILFVIYMNNMNNNNEIIAEDVDSDDEIDISKIEAIPIDEKIDTA